MSAPLAQMFMMKNCPLSCGVCTHTCNDTDPSCGSWAKQGECEENHESMLRVCPTSCGLCTPECKDLSDECAGWGAAGECNENPEFMIRTCPVTCEACKSTCRDTHSDCPGWTADGECYQVPPAPPWLDAVARFPCMLADRRPCSSQNPGFMYKTCPLSCGVCDGAMCADGNATQCEIWRESGECLNNPLAVMKECPTACGARRRDPTSPERALPARRVPMRHARCPLAASSRDPLTPSAGVCSTVCMDHDESCPGWAKEDQCDDNKGFMYRVCPASCGMCQELEGGDKDEL